MRHLSKQVNDTGELMRNIALTERNKPSKAYV